MNDRLLLLCLLPGMSRVEALEPRVHGRARDTSNDDELHFGVTKRMAYATNTPGIEGAQWTGIVTQVGGRGRWGTGWA